MKKKYFQCKLELINLAGESAYPHIEQYEPFAPHTIKFVSKIFYVCT